MIKRILHTSDWHLGRRLKEHERTNEFRAFFSWLEALISTEHIDALLVAGDIFDNTTPTVTAQNLYYSFLSTLAQSTCRHIVITSGNHDSPAFLDAPSDLLRLNNIHVIGQPCENPDDEVLVLRDHEGCPEIIVCAVPYLRDKDIRTITESDNPDDTERAITEGITTHYARVFECAQSLLEFPDVPTIAMGHMFAKGGTTHSDEGIRSLYVGTALQISADIFPEWLTYTALGHLHSPQAVGRDNIRYSGSPIPMTFGEAGQGKAVYVLELEGKELAGIRKIEIPVFQKLMQINGDLQEITDQLKALGLSDESVWLDVNYNGKEIIDGLQDRLEEFCKVFPNLDILSVRDEAKTPIQSIDTLTEGLDRITPQKMLELCFDANDTPEKQRKVFIPMYEEILAGLAAKGGKVPA